MKKSSFIAFVCATLVIGNAYANPMKNSDFLKFTEGQRHWWYMGTFSMLGHVVLVEHGEKEAQCIWQWYFKDPDMRKKQMEENFTRFPDHAPTSIVIALLRRDCDVLNKMK
ncbi:hypothetical protein [Aliikangiella sp. IMCC44359]|uniref:hypothetical protein n=1 Tax=Aliikangiella sp. IMCC44359 TaxID=3459125 RepID=UPI00403B34BC